MTPGVPGVWRTYRRLDAAERPIPFNGKKGDTWAHYRSNESAGIARGIAGRTSN